MHRCHSFLLLLALALSLAGCRNSAPAATATPAAPATLAPTDTPAPTAVPTSIPTLIPTPAPDRPLYELFIEPDDGRAPILAAIADARSTLRIAMYLFSDADLVQGVKDAAGRGVTVRLLLEMNPQGGGAQNAAVTSDLKAAGVDVVWKPRTFRFLHQKTLVVDEAYALVMTSNFASSSFTSNREYIVTTAQPEDVAEIIATFEADWARQPIAHTNPRLAWSPDNARQRVLSAIAEAQTTLDIEHQNMEDAEVIQSLVAAAQRGVKVRYISSPQFPLANDTDEPGREDLRQAGAQVGYLDDPYIHAKMMVIDGQRALVGSINLTSNSLDFNRELSLLVDDPYLVQSLAQQFEADWGKTRAVAFTEAKVPPGGFVDHTQAKEHFYQEVTIELPVKEIYNNGRVIWLMGDRDRGHNFKVVIFPKLWDKWPDAPDRYLKGKTIRVTGLIEKYRDWPEIVVEDPQQIEVVQ